MPFLDGTTGENHNYVEYKWTIVKPELFKTDPLLYSDTFETESDVDWQAVFEQCSDGTKKLGLKFLGCSVLGPAFPMAVEFECRTKSQCGLVYPITKIFDSKVNEHRITVLKENFSKLYHSSPPIIVYRIATQNHANFTIPRSQLLQDLPPKTRVLTDVHFKFPGYLDTLKAHKEILASRSSVFAAMFNSDMLEKRQNSVTIKDIHFDVFRQLLAFIYTDKLDPNTGKAPPIIELMAAADKYDLARLKAACERALFKGVSVSTAISTLILAEKHNAQQLRDHTLKFIGVNAGSVLRDGWETLVRGHPQLLLDVYQAMAKK